MIIFFIDYCENMNKLNHVRFYNLNYKNVKLEFLVNLKNVVILKI